VLVVGAVPPPELLLELLEELLELVVLAAGTL